MNYVASAAQEQYFTADTKWNTLSLFNGSVLVKTNNMITKNGENVIVMAIKNKVISKVSFVFL